MKKHSLAVMLVALCVLSLLLAGVAYAQGTGYAIEWSTIDGGGGASNGGGYTLNGTIGQADAVQPIGGGTYTLSGGFWFSSSATLQHHVYLPLVIK